MLFELITGLFFFKTSCKIRFLNQLRSGADVYFTEYIVHMLFYCIYADEQLIANLLVGKSLNTNAMTSFSRTEILYLSAILSLQ